ncbi:putative transposase for insertion sequence element, partial [Schinkia azotoformans LMG 9581]
VFATEPGKQFPKDVMIVAVAYYLRYNLSYREVQEMLFMTEELMYAIRAIFPFDGRDKYLTLLKKSK